MKRCAIAGLLLLYSCHSNNPPPATVHNSTPTTAGKTVVEAITITDSVMIPEPFGPDTLSGDFDGDGQIEQAFTVRTKQRTIENGIPDEYEIHFSKTSLPVIPIHCCDVLFVKEGDLNHDGREDFSYFQQPESGNGYFLHTVALQHGQWLPLLDPLGIPAGGDTITRSTLEQRVFLENGRLYYYEVDPQNLTRLIKKQVVKTPAP